MQTMPSTVTENTIKSDENRTELVRLDDIQKPILSDLKAFRNYFRKAVRSDVFLLDQIVNYLLKTKGKELRPALVFHTARICGGISERTYVAATMIELLHTATLIHDDVVDEADERRGFISINYIWRNKASVLLGDFLLAKGLLVALEKDEFRLLKVVSNAVRRMSEGELRQLKASKLQNMTEERYFKVISEKTASLISACCECGAVSAEASVEQQDALRKFGEYMGIAFQIRDDLFDYGTDDTGKSPGNDIKERKMTLPFIHALDKSGYFDRRSMRRLYRKKQKSDADIARIITFVKENGGVAYARTQMQSHIDQAREALEVFEDTPERQTLLDFTQYIITRRK